ncbi:hypothetical protein LTR66_013507 [Elasticomyces elasticus]|nr:hypothetical protein LTR66_013507 [Elasticomyces elasticus]
MQNRIDRLEGLVLSLMTNGEHSAGAAAAHAAIEGSRKNSFGTMDAPFDVDNDDVIKEEIEGDEGDESEVDQVAKGIGVMKVDNGRTLFASEAHWYAILSDIAEVKNYFASHKEQYNEQMKRVQASREEDASGGAFLSLVAKPATREELLASFPSKPATDRLVARYFNAYDPAVHIIHGPTFQKQYDQHWMNPNETSVVWLGLVYAIMTLALQSYHRAGDEPPEYRGKSWELSVQFRRLTGQCLVLADFIQPLAYMLETMILHVQAEYARTRDAEAGVLVLVGICVRLAQRMGYHRDPWPYQSISPFHGEMRRRVWTFVRQADLLFSFQFGLPSMIRSEHIDTEIPRNLYDDELYEEMTALPPSRPIAEATPMSYMIAKARLAFAFGKIVDRTQAISNPPCYEEIMKLDQELREVHASTPPHLRLRAMQDSARDPANLIMQRYGLECLYLKSQCVLHRKFVAHGRDTQRYGYSRRVCMDASMDMLSHQSTLHHEAKPGGRLRSIKWFISSLTTHDFLLAAMIVSLDLYYSAEAERTGRKLSRTSSPNLTNPYSYNEQAQSQERRESMLQAIEHCIGIWDTLRDQSMEAYKASATLRVMVDKLKSHQARMPQSPPQSQYGVSNMRNPNFGAFPNGMASDITVEDVAPEHSAALTLGMLSTGGVTPNAAFGLNGGMSMSLADQQRAYPASMAGILNDPVPERSGLTPQYPASDSSTTMPNNIGRTGSPFSQIFGTSGGFGAELAMAAGGDIDWGAWDSYIQGTNTDLNQLWPMNMDMSNLQPDGLLPQQQQQHQQAQQQQQPQQQQNMNNGVQNAGSVFMGATTPQAMM